MTEGHWMNHSWILICTLRYCRIGMSNDKKKRPMRRILRTILRGWGNMKQWWIISWWVWCLTLVRGCCLLPVTLIQKPFSCTSSVQAGPARKSAIWPSGINCDQSSIYRRQFSSSDGNRNIEWQHWQWWEWTWLYRRSWESSANNEYCCQEIKKCI